MTEATRRKRERTKQWFIDNPDYRREYRMKNLEKCRERSRSSARKWRVKNPDHAKDYYRKNAAWIAEKAKKKKQENPEIFKERSRRYWSSPKGRANFLLRSAKQRCKNITITREWIQERLDRGYCEVTGLPFVLTAEKITNPWSPSLDQKIPGQGYTLENTQLVVWIYNVAKGSWKHEDVIAMANALLDDNQQEQAA